MMIGIGTPTVHSRIPFIRLASQFDRENPRARMLVPSKGKDQSLRGEASIWSIKAA